MDNRPIVVVKSGVALVAWCDGAAESARVLLQGAVLLQSYLLIIALPLALLLANILSDISDTRVRIPEIQVIGWNTRLVVALIPVYDQYFTVRN